MGGIFQYTPVKFSTIELHTYTVPVRYGGYYLCEEQLNLGTWFAVTYLHGKYFLQAYGKISKQLGTSLNTGTFAPILAALKTSSDKLFQVDRESEKERRPCG
jgi:hypothetical protein